jgi:hypothetical protein
MNDEGKIQTFLKGYGRGVLNVTYHFIGDLWKHFQLWILGVFGLDPGFFCGECLSLGDQKKKRGKGGGGEGVWPV